VIATIAAVSRRSADRKSKLDSVPWALAAQAGFVLARRWRSLPAKDRARLRRLVRDSGGRPSSLSVKQRLELRRLVRKLDLGGLGRELLALRGSGRRRRRAHRRGARA
jgi:hypothetical protein